MRNQIETFSEQNSDASQWKNYFDETTAWNSSRHLLRQIPDAGEEILPGLKWGRHCELFTPAFWKFQYMQSDFNTDQSSHRLCENFVEEVVMCILGGYGIQSDMGHWAFQKLKNKNLIRHKVDYKSIYEALYDPISLECGKKIRYRFYNQKSKYIHSFLNRNDLSQIPMDSDNDLRAWLLTIDGIGLKTASWITRNWLRSDRVAILDIHLLRAGKLAGFITGSINGNFDYFGIERQYLAFCDALEVRASDMDAVIWRYMKENNRFAVRIISQNKF
jgi:N-glycosylase/DNA lyase